MFDSYITGVVSIEISNPDDSEAKLLNVQFSGCAEGWITAF